MPEEPDYLQAVRRAVARGDLKRAGEIQFEHGFVQEAYNLFERGSVYDRASECAERLGFTERAATQAERAGQLERAARLYATAGVPSDAARLFQRIGKFKEAADALEADLSAPPLELAQLWENAFLDLVPADGEPITPTQLSALQHAAERAAEHYKRAGETDRAAHFYELCDREDAARAIRNSLPSRAMDKLDQVRDRLRTRLRAALETTSSASYDFAPAIEEAGAVEAVELEPAGALPQAVSDTITSLLEADAAAASAALGARAQAEPAPLRPSSAPVAGFSLPLEVEEVEVFPTAVDTRPAIDRLGLESSDLGESASVFASKAVRDLLDPDVGLEHLDPSDAYPRASDSAKGDSDSDVIALGDHDPFLELEETAPRLDRRLVSAVVDEVLARGRPATPSSGVLTVGRRKSRAGQSREAHDTRRAEDIPTVGRVEVIHRTEAPPAPSGELRLDSDRYVLHEQLGEGGMGVVHRARDRVLERDVALKLLPEGMTMHRPLLALFEQEAKAAAQLTHPNIVTVHDYGVLGGRPYICMELVHGQTVSELLAASGGQGLPVLDVVRLAEGLLSALAYAHSRQIVHRDIKPSNVMRTREGNVKLMDFGIARLQAPDKTTKIAGTPAYMAPEQMAGKGIGTWTDLFALGVTLYEMMTGELPFEGLRRETSVQPPRAFSAAIPKRLEHLVLQCLEVEPERRPATADELLRAMESMRRQIESYLDRETSQPSESGSPPSVDMIDAETLHSLMSQLAAPESFDAAEAVPLFRAALGDPRPEVRAGAVTSYPNSLDPALRETVTALLHDESEAVRVAVIDRLGATGEHDLAGMLADRAREDLHGRLSSNERRALYSSLIEVANEQALGHLEHLFEAMSAPGVQTIESSHDERQVRSQLKDLGDALGHFNDGRADVLAERVRARQQEIEELLADAETPAPGRGGITPRSLRRARSDQLTPIAGVEVAPDPGESSSPVAEARARRRRKTALPADIEALLRDYLRDPNLGDEPE